MFYYQQQFTRRLNIMSHPLDRHISGHIRHHTSAEHHAGGRGLLMEADHSKELQHLGGIIKKSHFKSVAARTKRSRSRSSRRKAVARRSRTRSNRRRTTRKSRSRSSRRRRITRKSRSRSRSKGRKIHFDF